MRVCVCVSAYRSTQIKATNCACASGLDGNTLIVERIKQIDSIELKSDYSACNNQRNYFLHCRQIVLHMLAIINGIAIRNPLERKPFEFPYSYMLMSSIFHSPAMKRANAPNARHRLDGGGGGGKMVRLSVGGRSANPVWVGRAHNGGVFRCRCLLLAQRAQTYVHIVFRVRRGSRHMLTPL